MYNVYYLIHIVYYAYGHCGTNANNGKVGMILNKYINK